jgi:hypothetical protein
MPLCVAGSQAAASTPGHGVGDGPPPTPVDWAAQALDPLRAGTEEPYWESDEGSLCDVDSTRRIYGQLGSNVDGR